MSDDREHDDVDEESLAAEERLADADEIAELLADQEEETAFDETRLQYSGVEEGDGDVDIEEYAEAGALFDDPEQTVLLEGGMDDPDGSEGWR